jgi:hypothetical protein
MALPIGLPPKEAKFYHTSNRLLVGCQCHRALPQLCFNSSAVIHWLFVGQSVGWSVGQLVGWSVGRSVGQLVSRSVGWLVGQSVSRLVGRLVGRSVGRLVGRSVGRLVGRSTIRVPGLWEVPLQKDNT